MLQAAAPEKLETLGSTRRSIENTIHQNCTDIPTPIFLRLFNIEHGSLWQVCTTVPADLLEAIFLRASRELQRD